MNQNYINIIKKKDKNKDKNKDKKKGKDLNKGKKNKIKKFETNNTNK